MEMNVRKHESVRDDAVRKKAKILKKANERKPLLRSPRGSGNWL